MRATSDDLRLAATTTSADQLADLCRNLDVRVRVLCARNPALGEDDVRRLGGDHERSVRAAVAERDSLPAELVAALATDVDRQVRRRTLRHHRLDRQTLRGLVEAGRVTPALWQEFQTHLDDPAFCAELLEDPRWRYAAAAGAIDTATVQKWCKHREPATATMIARRARRLGLRSVIHLARHRRSMVGVAVATRPDLPRGQAFAVLLLGRGGASAAVLRAHPRGWWRLASWARQAPQVRTARVSTSRSRVGLVRAAASRKFGLVMAAAENERTGRLARAVIMRRRRWWGVRLPLAHRTDLAPSEYRRLRGHRAIDLALAVNPATPPDVIDEIRRARTFAGALAAVHPSRPPEERWSAVGDPAAPAWLLHRMLGDPALPADVDERLRVWLALGGGSGDPTFDPITCVGTPGSGALSRDGAYRAAANGVPSAAELWYSRALAGVGAGTLMQQEIERLVTDGEPSVRLVGARYRSRDHLLDLRFDPSPRVVDQAEAVFAQGGLVTLGRRPKVLGVPVPRSTPSFRLAMAALVATFALLNATFEPTPSTRPTNADPASLVSLNAAPWTFVDRAPTGSPLCAAGGTRVWVVGNGSYDVVVAADRATLHVVATFIGDFGATSILQTTIPMTRIARLRTGFITSGAVQVSIGDAPERFFTLDASTMVGGVIDVPDSEGDC